MTPGKNMWPLALALIVSLNTACANDRPPSLVLRLFSTLIIGEDTNALRVVYSHEEASGGEPAPNAGLIEEVTYPLGEGERAQWPQTLPFVAVDTAPSALNVELRLLWSAPDHADVVVGGVSLFAGFPAWGRDYADIPIARVCQDLDEDGYGEGFGCLRPDCNDLDPEVPAERFCDVPPGSEGGTAPVDACDDVRCPADSPCFMGRCARVCSDNLDCPEVSLACAEPWGVCLCRVPCAVDSDCGEHACVDGCCTP